MEKIARWKSNKEVDPEYPFYSRRAEDGTIYYSVPLEAPNDIPVDKDAPDEDKVEYSYLPLLGGKNLRVYCWETPDREMALKVRGMSGLAEIARSHLAALENGDKTAKLSTLWNIAYALEMKPSELIHLVEKETEGRNSG